jgi:hypothetical protein
LGWNVDIASSGRKRRQAAQECGQENKYTHGLHQKTKSPVGSEFDDVLPGALPQLRDSLMKRDQR